jgi:hypothetical protein
MSSLVESCPSFGPGDERRLRDWCTPFRRLLSTVWFEVACRRFASTLPALTPGRRNAFLYWALDTLGRDGLLHHDQVELLCYSVPYPTPFESIVLYCERVRSFAEGPVLLECRSAEQFTSVIDSFITAELSHAPWEGRRAFVFELKWKLRGRGLLRAGVGYIFDGLLRGDAHCLQHGQVMTAEALADPDRDEHDDFNFDNRSFSDSEFEADVATGGSDPEELGSSPQLRLIAGAFWSPAPITFGMPQPENSSHPSDQVPESVELTATQAEMIRRQHDIILVTDGYLTAAARFHDMLIKPSDAGPRRQDLDALDPTKWDDSLVIPSVKDIACSRLDVEWSLKRIERVLWHMRGRLLQTETLLRMKERALLPLPRACTLYERARYRQNIKRICQSLATPRLRELDLPSSGSTRDPRLPQNSPNDNREQNCSMCLEDFELQVDTFAGCGECRPVFHIDCLLQYVLETVRETGVAEAVTCPYCRRLFSQEDIAKFLEIKAFALGSL